MRNTLDRPRLRLSIFGCMFLFIGACTSSTPQNPMDICGVFEDRKSWHRAAKDAESRWGSPLAVSMAFIYQESSFRAKARPERERFLWILPGSRPSSAYGYAQALDSTWQDYIEASGNRRAKRSNFEDAVDFVAWYNAMSQRLSNIPRDDAEQLYLAYHEGNAGYQRRSFREKPWLLEASRNVGENAAHFGWQYEQCANRLNRNWWQRLWS